MLLALTESKGAESFRVVSISPEPLRRAASIERLACEAKAVTSGRNDDLLPVRWVCQRPSFRFPEGLSTNLVVPATAGSRVSICVHEAITPELALTKQLDKGIADTLVYVTMSDDQDLMFASYKRKVTRVVQYQPPFGHDPSVEWAVKPIPKYNGRRLTNGKRMVVTFHKKEPIATCVCISG
jgi:hypothetical protein